MKIISFLFLVGFEFEFTFTSLLLGSDNTNQPKLVSYLILPDPTQNDVQFHGPAAPGMEIELYEICMNKMEQNK